MYCIGGAQFSKSVQVQGTRIQFSSVIIIIIVASETAIIHYIDVYFEMEYNCTIPNKTERINQFRTEGLTIRK